MIMKPKRSKYLPIRYIKENNTISNNSFAHLLSFNKINYATGYLSFYESDRMEILYF